MFMILPERPKDHAAIETLLNHAFGDDRYAKASYAFRQNSPAVEGLSFSARCGNRLVGTIRFWPVNIGDGATPALLLGPLGVAPEMRNFGIGRGLITRGHREAKELGYKLVLLVGEEAYYRRFGYAPARPHGLVMPGEDPSRLMVHELVSGSLLGISGDLTTGDCLRPGLVTTDAVIQPAIR